MKVCDKADLPKTHTCRQCAETKPVAQMVVIYSKRDREYSLLPTCVACDDINHGDTAKLLANISLPDDSPIIANALKTVNEDMIEEALDLLFDTYSDGESETREAMLITRSRELRKVEA